MITCVVEYTIDAAKVDAFERFGRAWIGLVNKHGGNHHGERVAYRGVHLFTEPAGCKYSGHVRKCIDRRNILSMEVW